MNRLSRDPGPFKWDLGRLKIHKLVLGEDTLGGTYTFSESGNGVSDTRAFKTHLESGYWVCQCRGRTYTN